MKKNKYGEELICLSSYVSKDLHADFVKFAHEDGFPSTSVLLRKVLKEYAEKRKSAQEA